jgi:hypothetical protein
VRDDDGLGGIFQQAVLVRADRATAVEQNHCQVGIVDLLARPRDP